MKEQSSSAVSPNHYKANDVQCIDPHAQKEIQDLAYMVGDIIEPLYPVSWAALTRARHG